MITNRDKVAIVYKDLTYSYTEVLQYSLLYKQLMFSSAERVKNVMVFSENSPEYIFAIYASLRAKAAVVPIDVTSTEKELVYVIKDSLPDVIFVSSCKEEFMNGCLAQLEGYNPAVVLLDKIDSTGVENLPIEDIIIADVEQVVSIIYTSGTTGSPKGVVLSYKNYWYNVDAVANKVNIYNYESRVILLLPLHHVFPFAGALLAPLYVGGTVYIVENLAPETIIKTFIDHKITVVIGVPRLYETLSKGIMNKINASVPAKMMYKLAQFVGSRSFSKIIFKSVQDKFGGSMEYFVSGGAALPHESARIFKTLGFYVLEGYGMTECAPMIAFTRPGEWKIGYCGRLLPGVELRIKDSGELCVKGPNVMTGYYNRPEETAEIIRDGWLHTGDTGELHPKWGIKITGRIKEIIVTSNGKNINPAEIENEITQSSVAIKEMAVILHEDILQAIIYPDMAVVRSNTGMSIEDTVRPEIEAYNKGAMNYKRIMRFHIISQELPKTRLSKTQRFKLHELITTDKKAAVKEDVSDRGEVYLAVKQLVDSETKSYANGNDHFEIDLALDSLARVSLLASIEERFGIIIAESDFDNLSTLNILSAYIEERYSKINDAQVSWKEIFESTDSNIELPQPGFLQWLIVVYMKIAFNTFYRYTSSGRNNVPDGPCIFAGNHRSGFDGAFVSSKLKWKTIKKTYFFAKEKHFRSRFLRFLAKHNNIIIMDINSNIKSSVQQMYQVLKNGNNIVIFPEGTRSKDGIMKEFKDVFTILSSALNVPIVPVAISGSESATYRSVRIPKFLSRINVEFLPAKLPSDNITSLEFKEQVAKAISQALSAKH